MSIDKLCKYLYNKVLNILLILIALLCGSQKSFSNQPVLTPVIIEVVYPGGVAEQKELLDFCHRQPYMYPGAIYQWSNHLVILGKDFGYLYPVLKSKFKDCTVKIYEHPFYNFNRDHCKTEAIKTQWDDIILTANLVADQKKQKEYLAYHRTQFKKWPEVSQGFCNASFQRLLVYKNGRQLMLIISIPKGESLDKLNPLTTKNNPRVDEWNKIMAKYQEGIEGTKPGETWVFLKKVDGR